MGQRQVEEVLETVQGSHMVLDSLLSPLRCISLAVQVDVARKRGDSPNPADCSLI